MAMSMNIHNVTSIELGDINTHHLNDDTYVCARSIRFIDKDGKEILRIETFGDNGHNLLVADLILDEMKKPIELKAA